MGFLEDELSEVKKLCENIVPGSKLISCCQVMVRVEIKKTDCKKVTICIQFTPEYPKTPLLLELKSKTLSEKLLQRLTIVCEEEAKKHLRRPQILNVVKLLANFLQDNPLCCCYDEINTLKTNLGDKDDFKLKQKSSCIVLKVVNNNYFLSCRVQVPDNYPKESADVQEITTNFSPAFHRHMVAQAREIARKCVEPPIRKKSTFSPRPSLKVIVEFLIDCVKRIPKEHCQFCGKLCFPPNPEELESDENSPRHIERVYCGHLFHKDCFFAYMKSPPFGNKRCNACGSRIYHFKWSLSDKLAEDRWAHEQARERELQEVTDFFK